MYDLILKGGTVVDGTGTPGFVADIGIVSGKIARVAKHLESVGEQVVDCTGLVVAPGFVDVQNHSDRPGGLFDHPKMENLLMQGFTTVVLGNCGASLAPISGSSGLLAFGKWPKFSNFNTNWNTFADFKRVMSALGLGCDTASFVGLSTLFFDIAGEFRYLSKQEEATLLAVLREALGSGALGVSVGGSSNHEWLILQSVLPNVLKELKRSGGVLSVHLRSYSEEILLAVQEVVSEAGMARVPVKISHLQVQGKANWPILPEVLDFLEKANHSSKVGFDAHPYTLVFKRLSEYLPNWLTLKSWLDLRNLDSVTLRKTAKWMDDSFESLGDLLVTDTEFSVSAVGKTIKQLEEKSGEGFGMTCLDLLRHGGEAIVCESLLDEISLRNILNHPLCAVSCGGTAYGENTGLGRIEESLPHPRSFGSAPKFLGLARELGLMDLPGAITKLTSVPAGLVGLDSVAGKIEEGRRANLVVFDHLKIDSKADMKNPKAPPLGIKMVLVGGGVAVKDGALEGDGFGVFLDGGII